MIHSVALAQDILVIRRGSGIDLFDNEQKMIGLEIPMPTPQTETLHNLMLVRKEEKDLVILAGESRMEGTFLKQIRILGLY